MIKLCLAFFGDEGENESYETRLAGSISSIIISLTDATFDIMAGISLLLTDVDYQDNENVT